MRLTKKTLYLNSEKTSIRCKDGVIAVSIEGVDRKFVSFENISDIVIFGETSVSAYFAKECSEKGISISIVSPYGKYLCHFGGEPYGGVLLRKKQFDMVGTEKALAYAKMEIAGKLRNSAWLLKYEAHHNENKSQILSVAKELLDGMTKVKNASSNDEIMILEANLASRYFSVFDCMLKTDSSSMVFERRTRRPPENNCNVLLSFFYTLLTLCCESALCSKSLDPECGFLHSLRPGRSSLSCDIVEEFRAPIVDRFVISIINRKEVTSKDFYHDNDGIKLSDDARKLLLTKWTDYLSSTEVVYHLTKEKMPIREVLYEQAKQLAAYVRGDIDIYPPFFMS